MPYYIWYLGGGVLLVVLVVFILLMKRRKKRLEIERNAEDRLREEALDKILTGGMRDGKRSVSAFDVKYDREQRVKRTSDGIQGGQTPVMLQLTEKGELSTRKYMLHAAGRLSIGSRADKNDVVISGPNIADCQCEIIRVGKQLFISNLGKRGQVLLKRGKKQMVLEQEAVELQNNDILYIGSYTYKATILRD